MSEPRPDPRPLPPRPSPARPPGAPRPGQALRPEPARRRPDPGSLRMFVAFAGIASTSALVTAMLPSVSPVTDAAGAGSVLAADQANGAEVPAPSVRHVTRYVVLKPGQTAPPHASVLVRPTPTPRVTVVTRTRQSGKP